MKFYYNIIIVIAAVFLHCGNKQITHKKKKKLITQHIKHNSFLTTLNNLMFNGEINRNIRRTFLFPIIMY